MNQEHWNDWKWQLCNSIKTLDEIKKYLCLEYEEIEAMTHTLDFNFSITPYIASKMNQDDVLCPIRRQFVPYLGKTSVCFQSVDYLEEDCFMPVKNLIHKYANRVALLVTDQCASYCRYCTRRRRVNLQHGLNDIKDAIKYIEDNEQIRDVLITGGDPLILGDLQLEMVLQRLRKIPHVDVIRIGTRIPITLPMRITDNLLKILSEPSPIYINVHVNHPSELTAEAINALYRLANIGCPLGSQTVFLKGINDNIQTLEELFLALLKHRVKPYYIYQCDQVQGCELYYAEPEKGIHIINSLNGKLSGMAVPKFIIDTPGKYGKLVAAPCNISGAQEAPLTFRTRDGEIFYYKL